MILRSFQTNSFAGIQNRCYRFQDGLNVLYGENESGKSTVVEAIFSVLFRPAKLHKTKDKDFIANYFPQGALTAIDAALEVEFPDGAYTIRKAWGNGFGQSIQKPDGTMVQTETGVQKILRERFYFGAATYKYLIFSSQKDMFDALYHIIREDSIQGEVKSFLTQTVMEMDGISIEKLGSLIDTAISELSKNWDISSKRPNNNRGISNPYVVGVGTILRSYYDLEQLKLDLKMAKERELNFELAGTELNKLSDHLSKLSTDYQKYAGMEEDIRKRSIAEVNAAKNQEKAKRAEVVMVEWPVKKSNLNHLEEKIKSYVAEGLILEKEQENHKRFEKKKAIEELLKRIHSLDEKIQPLAKQLSDMQIIPQEEMGRLNQLEREQLLLEAKVSVTKLEAALAMKEERRAIIHQGLEAPHEMRSGEVFETGGYLKLEIDDLLTFEVKASGLDIGLIREKEQLNRRAQKEIKEKYQIESAAQGSERIRLRTQIVAEIKGLEGQRETLLGNRKKEELMSEFEEYAEVLPGRDIRQILDRIQKLSEEKNRAQIELEVNHRELKALEGEYISQEELMVTHRKLIEERVNLEHQLSQLKRLPDEYASADQFFQRITQLKTERDRLLTEEFNAKQRYLEAERQLPEESYEELLRRKEDLEQAYRRNLETLDALERIRDVFNQTQAQMMDNPTEGLSQRMAKYLEVLTRESIRMGDFRKGLIPRLSNRGAKSLNYFQLSQGSRDSVALALRLALIDELFPEGGGLLVLDDTLSDMDVLRKSGAIQLIRAFSNRHQVLFTTCDPQVAQQLGGHRIEMEGGMGYDRQ